MALTTDEIESAKPGVNRDGGITQKPYKMGDAKGLYLLVNMAGSKCWRLRYRFIGKQNTVSCGIYPEVSLQQARQQRDTLRALLRTGISW